jgi:hypothetical protein
MMPMNDTGSTESRLLAEIRKWSDRMERELRDVETSGTRGKEFLANIKAYMKDSGHFLEQGDLVRSFEAVIWAWAWLEIGRELGFLLKEYLSIGKP